MCACVWESVCACECACDSKKGGDCSVLPLCPFWVIWNLCYTYSHLSWYTTPPSPPCLWKKKSCPDVTISPRPRFSQATWRWFTSPRGRFTSRSGSSPCPRITSVSVCRIRTNCTISPFPVASARCASPSLVYFFFFDGTAGSKSDKTLEALLVFDLVSVSVPFVMSQWVNWRGTSVSQCAFLRNTASLILLQHCCKIPHKAFQRSFWSVFSANKTFLFACASDWWLTAVAKEQTLMCNHKLLARRRSW